MGIHAKHNLWCAALGLMSNLSIYPIYIHNTLWCHSNFNTQKQLKITEGHYIENDPNQGESWVSGDFSVVQCVTYTVCTL